MAAGGTAAYGTRGRKMRASRSAVDATIPPTPNGPQTWGPADPCQTRRTEDPGGPEFRKGALSVRQGGPCNRRARILPGGVP